MSFDPQSPSDRADLFPDEASAPCSRCGETITQSNVDVEAWEAFGEMLCLPCAEVYWADDEDE